MLRLLLFLLRVFGPHWGIPPIVADYLAASQRIGRDSRIPTQLIPIGLRLWARGWLNREFADNATDWVLPYWLVHQLDPRDPGYSPRGLQPVLLNNGYRDWTSIGDPESDREAIVDPRGLITPQFDGWSLDAWLRVDDHLFIPSQLNAPTLEQRLYENLPIVQTRYEPAGLRVLQEAFGATGSDGRDYVVATYTVENPRGEPRKASLYLALRPFNPEGVSLIKRLEFEEADQAGSRAIRINGTLGGYIPRPDAIGATSDRDGDIVQGIPNLNGAAEAESAAGLATGAAEYRLDLPPHSRRSVTAILPMTPSREEPPDEVWDWVKPEHEAALRDGIIKQWSDLYGHGMRIRVPDEQLQSAFDSNRGYLLLLHDGARITPGPFTYHDFWFRDAAFMLNALSQLGYHDQVAETLKAYPGRLQKDGYFLAQEGEWDSNGQALWTLVQHTRLSGDLEILANQYWPMLNAAHWIDYKRQETKKRREAPEYGLLPSGMSAEHLGSNDFYYWDDFWGLAGLRATEYAARLFNKQEDADKLQVALAAFWKDANASLARVAERTGAAWLPASPSRGADSAIVGNLVALYPLQLLRPEDPRIVATLDELARSSFVEDTFFHQVGHAGFGTYLALHIAGCYLYQRSAKAWPIIFWLLKHASPTYTWAEAISPLTHHGGMGDGHHGWAAADLVSIVRNALLFEEDKHLVLTPSLPADWTHETMSFQVENAPTYFGDVSYTIAFGDRSATIKLKANWREPPDYVEWNLPFTLKEAGGDKPGVEIVANYVRIPNTVRRVVATW